MPVIDHEKALKLKTQADIQTAMKKFMGGMHADPSRDVITSGSYDKLTRGQINNGVVAFVLQTNLSGGSIGDMDLYKLVHAYLGDDGARAEMNVIVARKNLM